MPTNPNDPSPKPHPGLVAPKRQRNLGSFFRLVFFTVLGLTLLSLATAVYLSTLTPDRQNDDTRRLVADCATIWKMGFGIIAGLIGGKALP